MTPVETTQVERLETKVYNLLEHSVTLMNNRFLPLRQKFSPKVAVMQNLLDINPEKKKKRSTSGEEWFHKFSPVYKC